MKIVLLEPPKNCTCRFSRLRKKHDFEFLYISENTCFQQHNGHRDLQKLFLKETTTWKNIWFATGPVTT